MASVQKGNHDWSEFWSKKIYYSETGGHVLILFFGMCQDKHWNGEGLPIWKVPTHMTWKSADNAFADGLRRYSDLEGYGVHDVETSRLYHCQWVEGNILDSIRLRWIGFDSVCFILESLFLFRQVLYLS